METFREIVLSLQPICFELMQNGSDPEALGSSLDWKEFETLAESAFKALSFETRRNVRFRKPRAEIDLVASKNGLAFAVDCKHWKRTVGYRSMLGVADRQLGRSMRLLQEEKIDVIPVIVTLHDESLHILGNGVPVVPIHKISDFVLNWEESRNEIEVLMQREAKSLLDWR